MKVNDYGGLFVAFDGPNGVGKSTLIQCLSSALEGKGFEVFATKEPTDSQLGHFVRKISECLDGESLACLVAADRYQHLKEVVIPQLVAGKIVITDRYVLSSLILQCMDNVTTDFVLAANGQVILPDVQVAVKADITAIQSRLGERSHLTRFEFGERSEEELEFMDKGISELRKRKVDVLEIDNTGSLEENVSLIIAYIMEVKT